MLDDADADEVLSSFARIENHYFVNDGWMRDGQLLETQSIDKMYVLSASPGIPTTNDWISRHIPCVIVQGRYDVVCPVSYL